MRISFKQKLLLDGFGQEVKQLPGFWLKLAFPSPCLINNIMRQNFIQFCNELSNLWDEINQTLWDKDHTIVVTKFCTLADNVSNVVGDTFKSFLLCSNLFSNECNIRMCLQSTLQCNVRSSTSHKPHKVVVLPG
ncbi:hypothetical protein EE612_033082 [Oryza sativa]|nr:hypothetical protein EE612_033082 [Oryza sativa]